MVGRLRRVLLKHPREAFVDARRIDAQWHALGFLGPPHLDAAVAEYDRLVGLLEGEGVETAFLPRDERTGLDSLYVHDPVLVFGSGAVLCRPGKEARTAEPAAAEPFLRRAGIPVLGAIEGEGRLEGGDVLILGPRSLAVGEGYRTNGEGIRQLRELLRAHADEVIPVPLPHWKGPADVLHLQSLVSVLDDDLALVHSPLLPVPFRQDLIDRGFRLLEVPPAELETLGCNVLALAPRRCLMVEGNPATRRLLEEEGVTVLRFEGREIALKGRGGPTCLTRPLRRD
jgi:N-dimethylarginine dimethylaminohydrolase